jgi:hypothetical protein
MALYRSWPAVSQICALMILLSTYIKTNSGSGGEDYIFLQTGEGRIQAKPAK